MSDIRLVSDLNIFTIVGFYYLRQRYKTFLRNGKTIGI
jgi:hypothetical protein